MDILETCKEVLKRHDINIGVERTDEEQYNMYYDSLTQKILINEVSLKEEYEDYSMPFKDVVEIIFCHELGHYLDSELEKLSSIISAGYKKLEYDLFANISELDVIEESRIKAEENAWNLAESLVNKNIITNFSLLKNDSLLRSRDIENGNKKLMKERIELAKLENRIEELKKQLP